MQEVGKFFYNGLLILSYRADNFGISFSSFVYPSYNHILII